MSERGALQAKRAQAHQPQGRGRLGSHGEKLAPATVRGKNEVLFVSAHGLEKVNRNKTLQQPHTTVTKPTFQQKSRSSSAPTLKSATANPTADTAHPPVTQAPPAPPATSPHFLDTWTYGNCTLAKSTSSERVSIHVHDEVNNLTRNFICRRETLLNEMKYFKSYLSHEHSIDDLDISVHCDVSIFKWLMEYVHNEPENRPLPDPTVAVSILISSDFLQMSGLVEESLQYIVKHIQEIIKLPIDLDCINRKLVAKISTLFTLDELDRIRDRKDKMIGSLFLYKLQELLVEGSGSAKTNVLYRCSLCGMLFTEAQRKWSICEKSSPKVTFHGESLSEHIVDVNWDISLYVVNLRTQRLSWKEIFWRLWAIINDDVCKVCGRHFVIAEIGHCCYHESLPRFEAGSSVGIFPCCSVEVQRFEGGTVRQSGCCARSHILSDVSQKEMVMNVISRHPYILIPRTEASDHSNTLVAAHQYTSDNESDTCSSSSDDTFGPEWRKRSKWTAGGYNSNLFSEGGDSLRRSLGPRSKEKKEPASGAGVSQGQPQQTAPIKIATSGPKKKRRKRPGIGRGGGDPGAANGPSGEWWFRLGSKAKQAYLVDVQRETDERRMKALVASLDRRRSDPGVKEKPPVKKV